MELNVENMNDVTVVPLPVDELDAANSAEFKRDMAPILEANRRIVLDLSRLRFIDSSGLGAFLSCLRKLNDKQGELKLCCVSKQVRAVLELVRMHRVIDICATRDEAVSAPAPTP